MTYAILQVLVEYCYNEHFDWAAGMHVEEDEDLSVSAEKLDALPDVLVAADRWLIPDLRLDAHQQVIAGIRFFVRPDNVKQVEKVADDANAEELRRCCEEHSIRNAEAILLANGGWTNGVNDVVLNLSERFQLFCKAFCVDLRLPIQSIFHHSTIPECDLQGIARPLNKGW